MRKIDTTKVSALLLALTMLFSLSGCCHTTENNTPEEASNQEASNIAQSYRSLIEGETTNGITSISNDIMVQILNIVAGMGYAVTDTAGRFDLKNPQIVTDFFSQLNDSTNAKMTIIELCYDGGFIKSDISVDGDKRTINMTRVTWNNLKPLITYTSENDLLELRYTAKGYLILKRNIPNNNGGNHDGYIEPTTMIRVAPLDKKCREYCEKYISLIGYDGNDLFLTDWKSDDMSGVIINDLFPILFRIVNNESLEYYNCPYPLDKGLGYILVPSKDFESLLMKYFNITSAEIKKWAVYDANTDSYPIAMPEMFGKESSKPVPEVTGYNENEDGTITLYVDALFVEYGTDKAFSHAVTIKVEKDGNFKYISNHIYTTAEDILPEYENNYRNFINNK